MAKREEERLLLAALRRIPVDCQVVLELHYWEEMSLTMCAEVLDVPVGTVKSRLRRARARLDVELRQLAEGPVLEATVSRLDEWAAGLRKQLPTGG